MIIQIITESVKNISDKEKIFVVLDYKHCRRVQEPNVYHIKTTVSDLKDEDFAKAAEEYKQNRLIDLCQKLFKREREREYLKITLPLT